MAGSGPRSSKGARFQRILWPTDFSPTAKAALPYAADLAADYGAQLVLLHVVPVTSMYVRRFRAPSGWTFRRGLGSPPRRTSAAWRRR